MKSLPSSPTLLMAVATTILASVYFIEYVLNYPPCLLCLYQRLPWYSLIILGLLGMCWQRRHSGMMRLIQGLVILTLCGSIGLAAYHLGVEFGLWLGPATCGGGIGNMSNADLKATLLETAPVRCDVVEFRLLGGSLALWNLIASGLLLAAAPFLIRNNL